MTVNAGAGGEEGSGAVAVVGDAGSVAPAQVPASSPRTPSRGGGRGGGHAGRQAPPAPNCCVVLKNLDYGITQHDLEEVVRAVSGGRKQFINVNLVGDRVTGQFRGMAFVNFHTVEDAAAALEQLQKMSINSRKVVAEYRRMRPGEKVRTPKAHAQHRRTTFESDVAPELRDADGNVMDKRKAFFSTRNASRGLAPPEPGAGAQQPHPHGTRAERAERDKEREAHFRARLLEYKEVAVPEGAEAQDMAFEADLTSYERRMVHVICDEIGLGHMSVLGDDGIRVLKVTKHPERMARWAELTADIRKAANERKDEEKRRRKEERDIAKAAAANVASGSASGSPPSGPITEAELRGIKWFKPRSAIAADGETPSAANAIKVPKFKVYVPPRQPTGPDGTVGFDMRKKLAGIVDDDETAEGGSDEALGADAKADKLPQHSPTTPQFSALNPASAPFIPAAATTAEAAI